MIKRIAHLPNDKPAGLELIALGAEAQPEHVALARGHFHLHDGSAWSFFKGGLLDE